MEALRRREHVALVSSKIVRICNCHQLEDGESKPPDLRQLEDGGFIEGRKRDAERHLDKIARRCKRREHSALMPC